MVWDISISEDQNRRNLKEAHQCCHTCCQATKAWKQPPSYTQLSRVQRTGLQDWVTMSSYLIMRQIYLLFSGFDRMMLCLTDFVYPTTGIFAALALFLAISPWSWFRLLHPVPNHSGRLPMTIYLSLKRSECLEINSHSQEDVKCQNLDVLTPCEYLFHFKVCLTFAVSILINADKDKKPFNMQIL